MIDDLRHAIILNHLIYKKPRVGYADRMTTPSRGESFARLFRMHRLALQDLYGQLSDDQSDFRAWDGGLSFIGLADHLAASSGRLPAMMLGNAPAPDAPASTTLTEARVRLSASTEQGLTPLNHLDAEMFSREVTVLGGARMTVDALLNISLAHEAHHKGQVWVMARLVGVQPPRYLHLGLTCSRRCRPPP